MKSDVLKSFAQKAKRRLVGMETPVSAKIKIISGDDSDFRSKVEYLLSQDGVVTNPVHYLVDDRLMKNMNEFEKERYLLSTLDKYCSLRQQIESGVKEYKSCL